MPNSLKKTALKVAFFSSGALLLAFGYGHITEKIKERECEGLHKALSASGSTQEERQRAKSHMAYKKCPAPK